MFPSTGHFRFHHCPFFSEGHCGRVYCHYRHKKDTDGERKENDELAAWEKEVCDALKIDHDTFNILVNEEDENVHEKLVNNKLKSKFPAEEELIDDFRFPESLDDTDFSSSFPTNYDTDELINLADGTSLDGEEEAPLEQPLEEDVEQNGNAECGVSNSTERRHIIVSSLDKIDKREGNRRPLVQPKINSNASVSRLVNTNETNVHENTDDIATQPSSSLNLPNFKQEASDSSESEDNAEVDKILSQMELLNPQLFSADEVKPFKNEPITFEADENAVNSAYSDESGAQTNFVDQAQDLDQTSSTSTDHRVGRINLKSIAAINNEFSVGAGRSVRSKPGKLYEPVSVAPTHPTPDAIVLAATIAEQNRLKNAFKSTICSNIDQFFDLSDACKVYGTEIFNLLEPLLNYLIEKLNPEFNYEKLRQLHSQNMSLSGALPFVTCCDHTVNCIECHNLLAAATSRSRVRTASKSTETDPIQDTPLRKIKAGLYDITKEMLSLGVPVDGGVAAPKVTTVSVQCQTSDRRESHSSHRRTSSHRHSGEQKHKDKRNDNKHESKSSKDRNESEKRSSSSSSKRTHTHSGHHSSKSSTSTSSRKREKRRKSDEGDESSSNSEDEHQSSSSKRVKSSRSDHDSRKKKRPSSDQSTHVEAKKSRRNSKPEPSADDDAEKRKNEHDSDFDAEDLFGAPLSDGGSDSDSVMDSSAGGNGKSKSLSQDSADDDSEDEKKVNSKNSNEFTDPYPTTANKKRISHVTDGNSSQVYRKRQIPRKHIPSPAEVMQQRMQNKIAEEARNENNSLFSSGGVASFDKLRISHVPNVNSILKAKERIDHDMVHKPPLPVRTIAQTSARGPRVAHAPVEPPKPKDVPLQAHLARPTIKEYKSANNIPVHIRQNGLDRLFNAYAKKVPADIASELALKEEQTIHEKVTIQKVYQNSLVMAIHRIVKETPDKLLVKNSEYPLEINGLSIYDLLSKHILTYEQLEINGYPLPHPSKPRTCRISMKAIHYKPLTQKRSGDRFYCQQCKELFDVDPKTGMPITSAAGCRFHTMRPRKEHGRTRHELYYPCCNSGISESGCMSAEHHTPDRTNDDCLGGFMETRDPPPGDGRSKQIYSLDCEMCSTTEGAELTRVTVIGHDCEIVYDSLVKPRNPILDYCTKFSGITEEKLRRINKRLEQVREELFKFIFKDSILIGHSLENDLKALKILHYKIVDTSVMYPHRDAPERKFSLKNLSAHVVQFLIQESEFGHDSKEDALACMKLVWKKIREDAQCYRPKKIISSPAAKNLVGTNVTL